MDPRYDTGPGGASVSSACFLVFVVDCKELTAGFRTGLLLQSAQD